ncbi:MAG: hypothetical protein DSM106950_02060 [Stigonema ocellatum SAG 48.90 = DSM 106950]|nr:hypothetical protein [Stigonema ocellatum SAG 48.90 = DSM 106950]
MAYIVPVTLYAFGNRKSPRPPRPNIDIVVDKDLVKPTQPPVGASTFGDIRYAPLTGHYYRIDKGTLLPEGLAVIADGEDVGGNHSPTHHTIYPALEMSFSEFVEKFNACGWIYTGKRQII